MMENFVYVVSSYTEQKCSSLRINLFILDSIPVHFQSKIK